MESSLLPVYRPVVRQSRIISPGHARNRRIAVAYLLPLAGQASHEAFVNALSGPSCLVTQTIGSTPLDQRLFRALRPTDSRPGDVTSSPCSAHRTVVLCSDMARLLVGRDLPVVDARE